MTLASSREVMITGVQNADRPKLIQRGVLEGLGKDVARYGRDRIRDDALVEPRISRSATFRTSRLETNRLVCETIRSRLPNANKPNRRVP